MSAADIAFVVVHVAACTELIPVSSPALTHSGSHFLIVVTGREGASGAGAGAGSIVLSRPSSIWPAEVSDSTREYNQGVILPF